jgi:hypothetical protein
LIRRPLGKVQYQPCTTHQSEVSSSRSRTKVSASSGAAWVESSMLSGKRLARGGRTREIRQSCYALWRRVGTRCLPHHGTMQPIDTREMIARRRPLDHVGPAWLSIRPQPPQLILDQPPSDQPEHPPFARTRGAIGGRGLKSPFQHDQRIAKAGSHAPGLAKPGWGGALKGTGERRKRRRTKVPKMPQRARMSWPSSEAVRTGIMAVRRSNSFVRFCAFFSSLLSLRTLLFAFWGAPWLLSNRTKEFELSRCAVHTGLARRVRRLATYHSPPDPSACKARGCA